MIIDWSVELPQIKQQAAKHGVDWAFVAAIRQTENGSAGREFGVLDVVSSSYEEQLEVTCATVAHRLETYPANPITRCYSPNKHSRVRYTQSFITYFSSIWSPVGATNDPSGLNKNWLKNATNAYSSFISQDLSQC